MKLYEQIKIISLKMDSADHPTREELQEKIWALEYMDHYPNHFLGPSGDVLAIPPSEEAKEAWMQMFAQVQNPQTLSYLSQCFGMKMPPEVLDRFMLEPPQPMGENSLMVQSLDPEPLPMMLEPETSSIVLEPQVMLEPQIVVAPQLLTSSQTIAPTISNTILPKSSPSLVPMISEGRKTSMLATTTENTPLNNLESPKVGTTQSSVNMEVVPTAPPPLPTPRPVESSQEQMAQKLQKEILANLQAKQEQAKQEQARQEQAKQEQLPSPSQDKKESGMMGIVLLAAAMGAFYLLAQSGEK